MPCSRVSPQSWTIPARSRDSNPQPRVTSPMLYPLEPRLPRLEMLGIRFTLLDFCELHLVMVWKTFKDHSNVKVFL